MLKVRLFNISDAWLPKLTCLVLLKSELNEVILHQIFKHWNIQAILKLCFPTFSSMSFSTYQLFLTFFIKTAFHTPYSNSV